MSFWRAGLSLKFVVAMSVLCVALVLPVGAQSGARGSRIKYPDAQRVDHVDEYHGTTVGDPYRWLEDDVRTSEQVRAWVEAQNAVTNHYLQQIPQRQMIYDRLMQLWDFERFNPPLRAGDRYYISRNSGLQNQNVIYTMRSLDGEQSVFMDPNTWSSDGTISLAGMSFTKDGRYCAYGKSEAGSDWKSWYVRDVQTGKDLPDTVRWMKWSSPQWTKDNKGFFYTRYPAPGEGAFVSANAFEKLYYHRLGTDQSEDVLVHEHEFEPNWFIQPSVTDDGRYLIITVSKGTDDKYRILYKDLTEPYGAPVVLIPDFSAEYSFITNEGHVFYFQTDLDTPRGRVIAVDITKPGKEHWREVIPQSKDALQGVSFVNHTFIASYLEDAKTAVRMFDLGGKHLRDVRFPGIGSAIGFGGEREHTETFYSFQSFATPPSVFRYDMKTGESRLLYRAKVDFNPDDYEMRQVFYSSKDGTQVPMFICYRKGLTLDGNNPTLLYGYGGFSIPLTPVFSVSRLAWMEMGGVFAMPNLRGGGEYGEEWHKAGTKLRKQNVFDDFIAAAEYLIANNYTRAEKIAIQGGSNGGLLVGACMAQRPELFGACLPAVGVMDMLRFHKFTIGYAWVDDFGSSDNPEEFEALLQYSPYHNIKPGERYPATLITTADTDDRVVPGHSFKFAAAMQYAQAGDAPTLIRIETSAGHGAGKPTAKIIQEVADQWAFLVKNLGVN